MEDATMKNFTKWMMAAAAMAVVAGSASAQTLKADVPFAFRTAADRLEAGSYHLRVASNGIVYLRNEDTHKITLARVARPMDLTKEWKNTPDAPRLAFECAGSDCALLAIYAGDHNPALGFEGLKGHREAQIAMVPITVAKR
jgi:hypothetical protein